MTVEFVLAGHSHSWSMGAPLGYRGPRTLLPASAYERAGFYVMEEDGAGCSEAYWDELVNAAPGRDAIVVWNGNQHWQFLFRQTPAFDLFDPLTLELDQSATILSRRIITAMFEPSITPLRKLLARLNAVGAHSLTTIGTPPPPGDMAPYIGLIKGSEFFQMVAKQQGVDLQSMQITPVNVLVKLWRVIQALVSEATHEAGGRFVAVPKILLDHDGYLGRDYQIPHDFTHAAAPFGLKMLNMALHPEEVNNGSSI